MNEIKELKFFDENIQQAYDNLNVKERQAIGEMLQDPVKFKNHYKELQDFFFVKRPPSGEEFLDWRNGWIPKSISEGLFDNVREEFLHIVNPANSHLKTICLMGSTRRGKSYLLRLIVIYTIVYFHHMRNVYDYTQSPTPPAIYLISFFKGKSETLMLQPILDLLQNAPNFIRVHSQKKVFEEQPKYGINKIVWSTATTDDSHLTLTSSLKLLIGNKSPLSIIGVDVWQTHLSELTFFIESAGATEEEILRLYTDAVARIEATYPSNPHLCFTFVDSSPNSTDSLIENHIYTQLKHLPTTYFRGGKQWDVAPAKRAPIWYRTGKTFTVVTGNGKYPPKIDPTEEELKEIPKDLIEEVPIDYYNRFKANLKKSINDILGKPSVSESKFISNGQLIERIFSDDITNIESILRIDSIDNPDKLIWDQIKDKFFTLYDGENYSIKRAPSEERWLGLDIGYSKNGDVLGITLGHYEWSTKSMQRIFVVDFSFAIGPGENAINLDAIRQFILDIHNLGGIGIAGIAFDTFEAEGQAQFLKRKNLHYVKQSVDRTTEPYRYLKEQILSDAVKIGRNIFLRNNLINLEEKTVKKPGGKQTLKIDHPTGETNNVYNGDWEKSTCGYFAKDVSDSLAQALYLSYLENPEYQPTAIFERENEKVARARKAINEDIDLTEEKEDEIYDSMMNAITPFDFSL